MDESALLDLLECPVCFERLDATAKVLPCQHTFCKRCLLGILTSRSELRCPECRTLVECSVEELPSNILLVRLLDGIRQRPRRSGFAGGSGSSNTASLRIPNNTAGSCGMRDAQSSQNIGQLQRIQTRSPPVKGIPQLPCAKALHNYEGKEPGDLKLNKGDIVILRRQVDENWYHGEVNGVHGFFPTNFVQVIKPLPQPPPQCKALYDFEVKDKEADKDCLPFSKDDILTVIRRVDENWAEGMLGDKIGIFPISYVEFNSAAKQLIDLDKPLNAGHSEEGISGAASNNSTQKSSDTKKNTKKRHSFTSLTMSSKSSQSTQNRHSMEISAPVLISSSNPTAAARISEITGVSGSSPSQVHIGTTGLIVTPHPSSPVNTVTSFTFPSDTTYCAIQRDVQPPPTPPLPLAAAAAVVSSSPPAASPVGPSQRPASGSGDQSLQSRSQTRPSVYVALYPYTPRKDDELELRKGYTYLVLERCQDGWFKGASMLTSKIGVFPGNYVIPVTRALTNSTQSKVPMAVATQLGKGVTLVSPSNAGGHQAKHAGNGTDFIKTNAGVAAATIPANNSQAKVLLHMTGQMTVNQARSAVKTAAAHYQERPMASVTPIQMQNPASQTPTALIAPQLSSASQQLQSPPVPSTVCSAAATVGRHNAVPIPAPASPTVSSASVTVADGDISGRTMAVLPGVPVATDSILQIGNCAAASRLDRDKVQSCSILSSTK
ncbi:E3 ubiquitin-protein ligase SH3RF1 isoform X2 [Protopterus annectens]|uniref:E3 ubiquitin-protein ligase SH3RF1 isoform X2 n=1 Tax=Protopterus annectens TaxID=7888 RepID=UPI001CFC00B5|nr:E3 ubiquitin-protein ligase SH3RF1 isoform X2 [Protopterus annectens]